MSEVSLNRASFSCPEAEVRGLFIHKGIVFAPKLYGSILALPSGFYQGRWICVRLTKVLLKSCLKEAVFWEAAERICRSYVILAILFYFLKSFRYLICWLCRVFVVARELLCCGAHVGHGAQS